MNERIRSAAAAKLEESGMTRAELARSAGRTRQEITRALNGGYGGGEIPPIWQDILRALDLELTATHKAEKV